MSLSPAEISSANVMTLNQVKAGLEVTISRLEGPACDRLRDLGFCERQQVLKISDGRNLICSIYGTRLAISRELAQQVLVLHAG